MCAINGFNFLDCGLIGRMNLANRHRGPDDTGVFAENEMSLGVNRLKIIDLSALAAQPMQSFDGEEVIAFNGEIYNFKELKSELKDFYPFKSESDTEVVLAAYRKWGKECVKKFNGIFALVIWDRAKQELFLARDHVGVKPLYYYLEGGKFIFSSEIKSILEHPIPRRLNREAFNHYFRVLYVPEPLTMFEGIYKFPQASRAFFKNGELSIEKYWSVEPGNPLNISKKHIEEELRNRLERAIKAQLISDRPLGLYLSGGIDSSVILQNMAEEHDSIDTFSVGFDLEESEQKAKFNSDFELARNTAAFFGTNHHEVLISPSEVWEFLEKAIWHMDEPISNPTAVAMLKLSEFSKEKVDVVLVGDGGDELFGGYDRYRLSLAASYLQRLPFFLRSPLNLGQRLKKLNTPAGAERFLLFMFQKNVILERAINQAFFNREMSKSFFEKKHFNHKFDKIKFEEVLMDVDRRTWLVDFALTLGDKMSMANGIEARVPFLDKDLVEFALRVPLKQKVSLFNTKIILKNAYKGKIPDSLLSQPKRGWFSPAAKWLRRDDIREKIEEVLSDNYYSETRGVFNWQELRDIFDKHLEGKEYNLNILWAVLTFQLWASRYNIRI